MTDEELIEQTKAALTKRGIPFGKFWTITRSSHSLTTVWFWRKDDEPHNHSCQFDEEEGKLLWCH